MSPIASVRASVRPCVRFTSRQICVSRARLYVLDFPVADYRKKNDNDDDKMTKQRLQIQRVEHLAKAVRSRRLIRNLCFHGWLSLLDSFRDFEHQVSDQFHIGCESFP